MRRRYRLRGSDKIRAIQGDGHRWRHPLVILLARPNTLSHSRFAFVASRRIGNAVLRNRTRRRLRESVRQRLAIIVPGWDCLFIARSGAPNASFTDLDAAVVQLLQRAQLLSKVPTDVACGEE